MSASTSLSTSGLFGNQASQQELLLDPVRENVGVSERATTRGNHSTGRGGRGRGRRWHRQVRNIEQGQENEARQKINASGPPNSARESRGSNRGKGTQRPRPTHCKWPSTTLVSYYLYIPVYSLSVASRSLMDLIMMRLTADLKLA